jgi:V/A-type H+-transporting ATPase subunit K
VHRKPKFKYPLLRQTAVIPNSNKQLRITIVFAATGIIALAIAGSVLALAASRIAASSTTAAQAEVQRRLELPDAIALLAGAIAVAASTLGAGYALGSVAKGGFAAAAEKPQLTVWLLIMGGLAEGIAVYGLLLAIFILGKIG